MYKEWLKYANQHFSVYDYETGGELIIECYNNKAEANHTLRISPDGKGGFVLTTLGQFVVCATGNGLPAITVRRR